MRSKQIPIDQIDEPEFDVRTYMVREELDELAESISKIGILQPIRVFERNGRYEIEDGHRRYLAARQAGLQVVPCIVVKSPERERELKKLHANLYSKDISPIELSRTLHHLKDKYGYSQEELAKMMGKSQGRIAQILALTNYDPEIVQAMEDKKISEHIGRALQQIPNPEKRKYYLRYAIDGGATVNTVRGWVAREQAEIQEPEYQPPDTPSEPPAPTPELIKGRCNCCRQDFALDSLMLMKFCGECYTDLRNIMPELYKAMKMERTGREQDESTPSEEEVYP
jgi:ParB family chromosome partitioning protein